MKLYSNTLLPEMKKTEVKRLITLTDETLDAPQATKKTESFTAAQLWNIYKHRRVFTTRRFIY